MKSKNFLILSILLAIPIPEIIFPNQFHFLSLLLPLLIFCFYGFGLHVVTGSAGLLNLGSCAFVAVGAYTFSILTSVIYPFQVGFWIGLLAATFAGAILGFVLCIPTLNLKGDYLAIVTLGFGEIIQDVLKNLDIITKGTQGINPVANPTFFGINIASSNHAGWYYLLVILLAMIYWILFNLEKSRVGRLWNAVKFDELAVSFQRISPIKIKIQAMCLGSSICALGGGLWVSYLGTSGEPGNYDFQLSIIILCMIIVGGLGNLKGVIIGSLVIVGMNSIVLVKLTDLLAQLGFMNTDQVWTSPNNWKYMFFGMVLILTARFRPNGICSSKERA